MQTRWALCVEVSWAVPGGVSTCHLMSSCGCLKTNIGKQRGRAGGVLWALDLGVKYPFGLDGICIRGHCVGDGHSTSPASDTLANTDIGPRVRRSGIPEVSAPRSEQADSQDFGVREQRKSFLRFPFIKNI